MSDGFDVDFSELDRLAADLGEVPRHASKNLRKAVEVTARNVKDDWADKLEGARALPAASRAIDYDIEGGEGIRGGKIEAEIGSNLGRRQGALVGFTEFGSPTNAPRGYGLKALQENEEDFERGLSKALEDAERESGL